MRGVFVIHLNPALGVILKLEEPFAVRRANGRRGIGGLSHELEFKALCTSAVG